MGKFSGKLLVADYDDTLHRNYTDFVPAANREAAEYFMAEGGLFTLATGRDPLSYLHIRSYIPINAPAVLSNGVVLFDAESGEDVFESFLPFSARRDMKELLAAFPEVGMEIIRGLDIRVVRSSPGVTAHLTDMGAEIREADIDRIMYPWAKAVAITEGALLDETEKAHALVRWIGEHFPGRYEAVPSGAIVDIASAGNNKGTGVAKLAEYTGIPMENVICVGDSWNDLPMLRIAGRAFAPENAIPEVKKQSFVTVVGDCTRCLRDIVEILEREG